MKRLDRRRHFFSQMQSAEDLLPMWDLLPDVSFFVKDAAGKFVALNRRGCEYCGVNSELDALGLTDADFFPPARASEYMADDTTVLQTGRPILNRVEAAPEQEGSPHLVVTNKFPLRSKAGKIIGVIGFSRSVEKLRFAPAGIKRMSKVMTLLHEHHAEPLSSAQLAKTAGLSVSQFERVFHKAFGVSPRQYLLRVRVENACRLLAGTDESIANVALAVGFYDHAHFTKSFGMQMGVNPSTYRKKHFKV
jgi:AraC-like DNA-binding protein